MARKRSLVVDRPVDNNEFSAAQDRLPHYEFVAYHEHELPALAGERGALVAEDLRGIPPVALCHSDDAFSYVPTPRGVELRRGFDDASTVVRFAGEAFSDFVNEIHSVAGLAMGGKLEFVAGDLASLQRWEPALRALYSGRPIWTVDAAGSLVDESGRPLDLGKGRLRGRN